MRIHFPSSPITSDGWTKHPRDLAYIALNECQQAGTIAKHVTFKALSSHNRKGTGSALEVQLEASESDRGRRSGNSGSYGAMSNGTYAATYDEWGFFLAALYRHAGSDLICGTPKHPVYADEEDFHFKTGRTYDPAYVDYVGMYGDDYLYRGGRNQMGRRGAGRVHYDNPYTRYTTEDPRTADFLRDLQAGKTF